MKSKNLYIKSWQLLSVIAVSILPVHSQEIIDHAYVRASYDFSYKTNPAQTEYAKTDLMYLDIGERVSKFYSRYEQTRDSIKKEGIDKSLSAYEIVDNMQKYVKGTKTVVYHIVEDDKIYVTDNLMKYYTYEEPRSIPIWRIDTEQKEIGGYLCQKSTGTYLGRVR